MAYLSNCVYCKGQILDASWHPECRIAYLENLLLEIKQESKNGALSPETISKVNSETWQSWADFQKRQSEIAEREDRRKLWGLALQNHLQKAREEFELEHPNPIPIFFTQRNVDQTNQ